MTDAFEIMVHSNIQIKVFDIKTFSRQKIAFHSFRTLRWHPSHYGSHAGIRIARKHIGWYSKGLPGSAEFRAEIMTGTNEKDVISMIKSFYEPLIELKAA